MRGIRNLQAILRMYDRYQHPSSEKTGMTAGNAVTSKLNVPFRYGLAIAFVGAALLLSYLLRASFGNPTWFFFPAAVMASTWFGGMAPGWLAVVLSTLAVQYFFVPPVGSLTITSNDVPFFAAF